MDKGGKNPMKTTSGSGAGFSGPFLGDTKGNRDIKQNLSQMGWGGKGEGHSSGPSTQFIGPTKGNTDVPIDRTKGTGGNAGGKYTAGGAN